MSQGYGFLGFIGIGKQSAFGTAVAATDYIEAMSESLNLEIDRFPSVNINNQYGEPSDATGIKRIAGDMSFNGNPNVLGYFLKGALQTTSVVEVASGELWTTKFFTTKKGDEFNDDCPLQPYTFEIFRDVTSSVQYSDVCIDSLSLNFQPNQDVRVTAGLIGVDESSITSTTPTFTGSPSDPFYFNTASIQLGGAATAKLEALTIDIANNLEGVPRLNNSLNVGAIKMTDYQMVDINGTVSFQNLDDYDDFKNQTEQQLIVSVTKASSFQMVVDIPKMVYTAFPTEIGGRERQTVDFTGKGFFHSGSGTNIQIDLTTVKSDY